MQSEATDLVRTHGAQKWHPRHDPRGCGLGDQNVGTAVRTLDSSAGWVVSASRAPPAGNPGTEGR